MSLTKVDAQLLNGAVTADSSGNVGIGTSANSYTAAGRGNLNIAGSSSAILGFQVNGSPKGYVFLDSSNNFQLWNESASSMLFGTNATERMRIDSSGNLFVGTAVSNPTSGFSFYNSYDASGASAFALGHVNGSASGTRYFSFVYNGGQIGSITQNGTTATAYNTSSDYRLKENIAPMKGALDVVQQLKPVTYNWKVDGSSGQGFIAHELQAVVPECVTGEKDAVDAEGKPVYQGIDTSFLVATLVAAIQELKAEVDALKAVA